ncbi:MAG: hypothetical protein ACTSQJ_00530, partial [Promethearchaeota archaeon]
KIALKEQKEKNYANILKGWVGTYPTSYYQYEIVISQDPVDITTKSTGRKWERASCERIGGCYGNPTQWIREKKNCGFCSDIEYGNLILYIKNIETGEWEGRQMMRWCKLSDGTKGLGIEKKWYGNKDLPDKLFKERDKLLHKLSEKTGIPIEFEGVCVTPYVYAGYSDIIRAGNTKIRYPRYTMSKTRLLEKVLKIVPMVYHTLFEHLGEEIWCYSYNPSSAEYYLSCIEHYYIPDSIDSASNFYDIIDILTSMYNYNEFTLDFDDIKEDILTDYLYADADVVIINSDTELDDYIAEMEEEGEKIPEKIIEDAKKILDYEKWVIFITDPDRAYAITGEDLAAISFNDYGDAIDIEMRIEEYSDRCKESLIKEIPTWIKKLKKIGNIYFS